jgi:hypothetical protein
MKPLSRFDFLFGSLGGVVLVVIAALSQSSAVWGATQCVNVSCGMACNPAAPVDISTLVAPGDFPVGATTPIAFVDPLDGGGRRLIATQEGAILVWDGSTRSILPTWFIDLRDDTGGPVLAGGERGLLALAVDPDYASTGYFYVFYTAASSGPGSQGDIVIERYQRSTTNPDVANPNSALTIMVIEHSSAGNHNGGWLAFGPNDGFLYIATGDGGGGCDSNQGTNGDGQRTDTLAGKLLRIDVRGIDGAAGSPDCGNGPFNYTVPSTNPFFGQEPACDEVWALGLRNPFRFSFDRQTGDVYIGDVGQNKWEEINMQDVSRIAAPVNFGWVCREGCETAANNESNCAVNGCPVDVGTSCQFPRNSGYWDPILCHHNGGWRSIMGGYRYRGGFVPSIDGDYFYGDNACGQIWKTTTLDPANPAAIASSCWASGYGGTFGFAEDSLGELYVVRGGSNRIECIHNGEGCFWAGWGIFADGFESGDLGIWDEIVP